MESQEVSSFPEDGHQAILNKMNKIIQRLTESGRTMTVTRRINHNRSIALERSVINYWERATFTPSLKQIFDTMLCILERSYMYKM